MHGFMKHCIDTKEQGLLLKLTGQWGVENKNHKFKISGKSDSDCAKDPETQRSVSG